MDPSLDSRDLPASLPGTMAGALLRVHCVAETPQSMSETLSVLPCLSPDPPGSSERRSGGSPPGWVPMSYPHPGKGGDRGVAAVQPGHESSQSLPPIGIALFLKGAYDKGYIDVLHRTRRATPRHRGKPLLGTSGRWQQGSRPEATFPLGATWLDTSSSWDPCGQNSLRASSRPQPRECFSEVRVSILPAWGTLWLTGKANGLG